MTGLGELGLRRGEQRVRRAQHLEALRGRRDAARRGLLLAGDGVVGACTSTSTISTRVPARTLANPIARRLNISESHSETRVLEYPFVLRGGICAPVVCVAPRLVARGVAVAASVGARQACSPRATDGRWSVLGYWVKNHAGRGEE